MITKPRGTKDILPEESKKWQKLESILRTLARLYDYKEIRTPLFEASSLFHRGVGEGSDIVTKETYDFIDRGNREMTLKPEGTASIVRSFIENKLYAQNQLNKLYYISSLYRYENPQKGRLREFHQFGVEALGSDSYLMDAEVIKLAYDIFNQLGFDELKIKINTLGDKESRDNYRDILKEYFSTYKEQLCHDCLVRLEKNPLRILDCKTCLDQDFHKKAPKITDYLSEDSKIFFNNVIKSLDKLNVPYEIDDTLVRGLDYYNHTVFEIEANIKDFGAQNVLAAGGRYDNLVSDLDGPKTPAVGFALGMERLILAMESLEIELTNEDFLHFYIIPIGDNLEIEGLKILTDLRLNGLIGDMCFTKNSFKNKLKQADDKNTKFILILGEDEWNEGKITIKNCKTKEQKTVLISELKDELLSNFMSHCHSCNKGGE